MINTNRNIKENHKQPNVTATYPETEAVPQIIMPEAVRIWLKIPPTHGQCVRPKNTGNRIEEKAQSEANKPITGDFQLNAERVSDMLWAVQHWRLKTKGSRIECQRHHLRILLSKWSEIEVSDLISLVRLAKRCGFVRFRELHATMPDYFRRCKAEDVIYEDIERFERLVLKGLGYVAENLIGWTSASLTPERASALVGEITAMLRVKEPDFMREEVCDDRF